MTVHINLKMTRTGKRIAKSHQHDTNQREYFIKDNLLIAGYVNVILRSIWTQVLVILYLLESNVHIYVLYIFH